MNTTPIRPATVCAALLLAFCAAASATEPAAADSDHRKASTSVAQGHYHEALFYYGQVLMRDPGDRTALLNSGLVHLRLGQAEAASVQLQRLQAACGRCPEALQLDAALNRPD